ETTYEKKAEKFLKTLEEKYPELKIKSYEVFGNKENADLLLKLFESCEKGKQIRVPAIFIGEEVIIGYSSDSTTGVQIEDQVLECLKNGCQDPLEKLEECEPKKQEDEQFIEVPFFGKIDLSKLSLPVLTVTLAALDGLNPCAMWVLLFLIALLINAGSRKRMWLIGGTFILASGIVYFFLLTAWLNFFLVISYVNLTRVIIGIFALAVGAWQIKEFATFRSGVCKVVEGKPGVRERLKNGLQNHAERLVASPVNFGIVIGIIILALGVNLVEFFYSAGLPATFTRILTLNSLSSFNYYFYLLLYTIIFMLDDLIIFSLAALTLSKIGVTEKYNYWATLIGGLLMIAFGLLLVFRPELLMFG
ncbi:hypothetical protein KKB68_01170, partial [Patescibacteria group bacterium]|nr:hypothetical protein [Patescibacteria group bacterium]